MSDKTFYNNYLAGSKLVSRMSRLARTEIYELFLREMSPSPQCSILDIGVSVTEQDRLEENILEQLYPHLSRITMLGIHEGAFLEQIFPGTKYVQHMPGSTFPFADDHFDICYCNAVVEHVGEEQYQREFVREVLRISRKVFLTTPNRGYPIDFHKMLPFLHWLPMDWYRNIISWGGDTFYSKKENLNLLYKKDLVRLFEGQGIPFRILSYNWFGLPAYLIAVAKKQ
ncbi:class I SAM-dependent methyltransferase [bacterium]|nr:class I SAM-dependent methyltransferase [bacterium]MCI0602249.1 class I SAM-dependent methyltransferase [bacterium]